MKKLRIIYYSPHPTHDIVSEVGYSTHQRESIAAFRLLGHEVLPVVLGGTEPTAVKTHIDGLSQKAGGLSGLKKWLPLWLWNALKDLRLIQHDRRARKELETAIIAFKPDMIYERGEYLQDGGVLMANQYRVPHYLEVNSPVVEEMAAFEGPDALRFLGHWKERSKLRKTDKVIAVSSALKSFLTDYYGCKKPILVAPNAINPERNIPTDSETDDLKKHVAANGKIIGFVGSLFPYHGVDLLIEAFALLSKEMPDVHLLIVGDGSIRAALEQQAHQLLPREAYTFTGKVPHAKVMGYIATFDVAVMAASNWYGSPIKVFEYGLMGIPIIAPDNIPVRDVMENGKDGLLVQPTASSLLEALRTMLQNPEGSKTMGKQFKEKILRDHTWEVQSAAILESATAERFL